jgi:Fur family transcriptional regulator, ferric uptake regulator
MSCEDVFTQQLHLRGFRLTPQRELVLLALHQVSHPASAEEIFDRVTSRSANIELSTVYRTLDLLASLELVNVISAGEKQRLFELAGTEAPHMHLVCRVCGQIIPVKLEFLRSLLDHIKDDVHFNADLSNLTLAGICKTCACP